MHRAVCAAGFKLLPARLFTVDGAPVFGRLLLPTALASVFLLLDVRFSCFLFWPPLFVSIAVSGPIHNDRSLIAPRSARALQKGDHPKRRVLLRQTNRISLQSAFCLPINCWLLCNRTIRFSPRNAVQVRQRYARIRLLDIGRFSIDLGF